MPPPVIERSENSYQRLPSFLSEPVEDDQRNAYGVLINDAIPDEPVIP